MSSSSNKFNRLGRRCAQALLSLAVAGLMAACGGGGSDAGTPIFQDPTTPVTPPAASTLADLALVVDKQKVPNTGAEVVTYTVTALGAGNAALIGVEVPVTVEVDAGALVTPSAKVTDKTSANLTAVVALIDKTSRTVTLTAKSGAISKKLSFNVVDSVTGSAVADLSVVVDKLTIPNTGAEVASITVTTLDAARSAVGGVAVSLQVVDVGDAVVLDPGNTSTNASSGQLTRRLSLQNNKTKRTIAVKATSGTVSRTITVDVVDPPAGTVLTANDLTLSISKNSINNSGSETVDVIARAVDANRNALAGIDVIFRVDNDAVLTPINTKTDAKGEAKATVGIGANRTVRTITVTAESNALRGTRLLSVTGARLQATVNQPNRLVGEAGTVDYSLLDVNGSPIDGVEIVATGPGAATGRGLTNGQGKWTYAYKAEGNGKMSIKAVGGAGDTPVESFVNVASKPAALDPAVKILSATMTLDPLVVKVNEIGKDVNRAEIRLLFRGEKNAPIENVRVHVGLGPNNTSTDGRFSVSETESPLLSDKNGLVTLSYIAGERASPTEGVKIYGCYGRTDDLGTTVDGCTKGFAINPVTLTVVESPISISIGGDDGLAIGETELTYIAKFTVLVVDAAGNPKSDVQVAPVIDLLGYGKGYFVFDPIDKKWVISINGFLQCPNEDRLEPDGARNGTMEWNDINGNGIVDAGESEDINNSLQLDPRKSDVSVSMVGSTKTDKNGLATLRIEYPKSIAAWVRYMIKVSAPGVLSPPAWYGRYEPRWLPTLAAAIKSENEPAFRLSPYGLDSTGYVNSSTDPAVAIGAGCFNKK